jgi:general secretion pathway protein G
MMHRTAVVALVAALTSVVACNKQEATTPAEKQSAATQPASRPDAATTRMASDKEFQHGDALLEILSDRDKAQELKLTAVQRLKIDDAMNELRQRIEKLGGEPQLNARLRPLLIETVARIKPILSAEQWQEADALAELAVRNRAWEANPLKAMVDISNIEGVFDMFEVDNGRFPTTEEGLRALLEQPRSCPNWKGPYLRRWPKDPWGNDYIYRYPGQHNPQGFDVYSIGQDGQEGTADDIGNWEGGSPVRSGGMAPRRPVPTTAPVK